eukprot:CAMPEP_0117424984 /NCGR_PEP_ID=MMETSP0758-20121206/5317_1 /TAXON_ID=63605 /ORGANISM="Percolomonas cosmopolitus, Strain AE-1 (ATCC 50343)" /LENGTH=427 /DNA_ID=CAMNT_0005209137 /DNA_START=155 /DNA_END=1438 /DNA_ORIENTATION=-
MVSLKVIVDDQIANASEDMLVKARQKADEAHAAFLECKSMDNVILPLFFEAIDMVKSSKKRLGIEELQLLCEIGITMFLCHVPNYTLHKELSKIYRATADLGNIMIPEDEKRSYQCLTANILFIDSILWYTTIHPQSYMMAQSNFVNATNIIENDKELNYTLDDENDPESIRLTKLYLHQHLIRATLLESMEKYENYLHSSNTLKGILAYASNFASQRGVMDPNNRSHLLDLAHLTTKLSHGHRVLLDAFSELNILSDDQDEKKFMAEFLISKNSLRYFSESLIPQVDNNELALDEALSSGISVERKISLCSKLLKAAENDPAFYDLPKVKTCMEFSGKSSERLKDAINAEIIRLEKRFHELPFVEFETSPLTNNSIEGDVYFVPEQLDLIKDLLTLTYGWDEARFEQYRIHSRELFSTIFQNDKSS